MSEQANTSEGREIPKPHWWPDAEQWQRLPGGLREAAESTILPAHEELVGGARGALERVAAGTLVYLLWLELVQQGRLAQALVAPAAPDAPGDDERLFKALMRLLSAKNQAWRLVQQARQSQEPPVSPRAPSPPASAPADPPRAKPPAAAGAKPPRASASAPPSAPLAGGAPSAGAERERLVGVARQYLRAGLTNPALSERQRQSIRELLEGPIGADREQSGLSICPAPAARTADGGRATG